MQSTPQAKERPGRCEEVWEGTKRSEGTSTRGSDKHREKAHAGAELRRTDHGTRRAQRARHNSACQNPYPRATHTESRQLASDTSTEGASASTLLKPDVPQNTSVDGQRKTHQCTRRRTSASHSGKEASGTNKDLQRQSQRRPAINEGLTRSGRNQAVRNEKTPGTSHRRRSGQTGEKCTEDDGSNSWMEPKRKLAPKRPPDTGGDAPVRRLSTQKGRTAEPSAQAQATPRGVSVGEGQSERTQRTGQATPQP